MKPLSPNSMIQNRYLVVQAIGKGGMGEVYLAVDQRLGSAVALKRTFFTEDNALAAAFEREARILARLRHPVLPKVIDHFVENNDQYLVMEHISGDDLSKRLEAAQKPFPLSWVMFWADQLLDALSYLHAHEPPIIHRDIKPQNLKLTDENHIVLLDFGLSKDFDTKSTSNPLNSASVAGYSPHFASMEQIRGTGTDARSDLYSLAATLYQLMTNEVPIDALSRADALLGKDLDPIKPLNELNPEVTPAISEVILKGVAIRQDDRFSTAAEMQKALRRAFDQSKSTADAPAIAELAAREPLPEASPTDSQPSEMETRAYVDTGAAPIVDQTLQMPVAARAEESTSDHVPETETKLSDKAAAAFSQETETGPPPGAAVVAAGAAAGSAAIPPATTDVPAGNEPSVRTKTKPKRSSSKAGYLVAGMVGLLLLAAVTGGAGYYLYTRNSVVKPGTTPSPTPSPQPSVAPSVMADADTTVPEATPEGRTSPESNSSTESNVNPSGSKTTTQSTKVQPVKAPSTQPVKPTPKPKQKDDRTVIIQ